MQEESNNPIQPTETALGLLGLLLRFCACWLVVMGVGTVICRLLLGAYYIKISLLCGFIVFVAGILSVVASCCIQKRYGAGLAKILVSAAIRTGIPLGAVLVFFSLFDKNIFSRTVFIVFGYYMMLLVFEVVMFIRKGQSSDTGKT